MQCSRWASFIIRPILIEENNVTQIFVLTAAGSKQIELYYYFSS